MFTDTYIPQMNGAARTLGRLSGYLQRKGIEHLVFSPRIAPGPGWDFVREVASIPFFLYPECRLALPNLLAIRGELDRFRPDLLHLATPFNVGLCGLRYARRFNLPHVASYHTHFDRYLDYYGMPKAVPLYWRYASWFHRTCGATFVPSRETMFTLYRQGFGGLRLWPRGVDCDLFTPEKRMPQAVREQYGIPRANSCSVRWPARPGEGHLDLRQL